VTGNYSIPPLRDLPPGRRLQRKQHLLAEISGKERQRLAIPSLLASRRRVFALAGTGACVALVFALGVIVGSMLTDHSTGPGQAIATDGQARTQSSRTMPTVSAFAAADWAFLYFSIDRLARDAAIIVRGKVTDVSYFDRVLDGANTTYTKVTLDVTESLKGGLAKGRTLTFIEIGGVTTQAANSKEFGITPSQSDEKKKVRVLFFGAPLPEIGEDIVYFAARGDLGQIHGIGTYYVPVGAFQGAFVVTDGMAARYVPKSMVSDEFGTLRMSVVELEEKVRDALSTPRTTDTSPSSQPARSTPSK
jgi:hypothetical protein